MLGPGQSVLLNWTPSPNAQNQRIYRILNTSAGSPANNWQYKALGGADDTFTDSGESGWTPGAPPDAFSGPQPAFFRLRYGASATDTLKETVPVQAVLANGRPEFLRTASLTLPPGPRPEPLSDDPGPFYVELQAMAGPSTLAQGAMASVDGVWPLALPEPRFEAELETDTTDILQYQLDHRRDKRNSGRAYSGETLVAAMKVSGSLELSSGGNYLTILAWGPGGVASPDIRFTVQAIYTPRTEFAFGLG